MVRCRFIDDSALKKKEEDTTVKGTGGKARVFHLSADADDVLAREGSFVAHLSKARWV